MIFSNLKKQYTDMFVEKTKTSRSFIFEKESFKFFLVLFVITFFIINALMSIDFYGQRETLVNTLSIIFIIGVFVGYLHTFYLIYNQFITRIRFKTFVVLILGLASCAYYVMISYEAFLQIIG